MLTDEGLAAAIEALADDAPTLRLVALPHERFPAAVETAAYLLVAEAASAGRRTSPRANRDGVLVVDVEPPDAEPERSSTSRTGSARSTARLGGERSSSGGVRLRAELPCGVVVADDSMLLREGLARLLADAGFEVVGQGRDRRTSSCAAIALDQPDVAIVDIKMPPTHTDEGIVAAQEIRRAHPAVGVLVLSQYLESRYAHAPARGRPRRLGYLLKDASPTSQCSPTPSTHRRRRVRHRPDDRARLLKRPRERGPLDELTHREREVLGLMAEGRSNYAICRDALPQPEDGRGHTCARSSGSSTCRESADDHRRVLAVLEYLRAGA